MSEITDLASARAALVDAATKLVAIIDGSATGFGSQVETAAGLIKTFARLQAEANPVGQSASEVTIGTGEKTFVLAAATYLTAGTTVYARSDADPLADFMFGRIVSVDGTDMTVDVETIGGSGTHDAWTIRVAGERGAAGATGSATSSSTVAWTGALTPPQIASDQNDFNPTSLSTAAVLRVASDTTRILTGLAGGSGGRLMSVFNVGTGEFVLAKEHASSTAANRFAFPEDLVLRPGTGVLLQYDGTSSRWRLASPVANAVVESVPFLGDIKSGAGDRYGNITWPIFREGGGIETEAFFAGDDGALETVRFKVSATGDGRYAVQDDYGNITLLIAPDGEVFFAEPTVDEAVADVSPIVGADFFLISGRPALPLYGGGILSARYDPPPAVMTVSSGDLSVEGTHQLLLDPALAGTTGEFTMRRADAAGIKTVLGINIKKAPAGSGQAVRVHLIGDSITKGDPSIDTVLASHVRAELTAAGYAPTMCGTILNTGDTAGNLHEGRASRDMDDYVGARILNMAPVTDDAAYIAGNAAYKAARNPFIVAVSGGADVLGTGWLVDYGQYRSRFSIAAPHAVVVGLGTNSLIGVTVEAGIASILRGMNLWRTSIRADLGADAAILFWMPPLPRDPESDGKHHDRRAPALRAMIERVRSYADARCFLLNTHAHVSLETGWVLGATTTDAQTGVVTSTPDLGLYNLHPLAPGVRQIARAIAASAAWAATA